MIDESLLKSNFLGRDGFRWWIGQIPPVGAQGAQANGGGWGNRVKVRIMGYHPYYETELKNEDLPWAQCLIPTTSGSGASNYATDVKIKPGDVVFGFFLDGDNAQIPVIMGTFGRTSQVPSKDYVGPFQPFTGYTDKVKKPNGTLKPDQTNEQNAATQKSPRHVSGAQAKSVGSDEISYYGAIGDTVEAAKPSGGPVSKIDTEIVNFTNKVNNLAGTFDKANSYEKSIFSSDIEKITEKIKNIVSGLVGSMVNNLFTKLAPIINKGLKMLYDLVYKLVLAATQNPTAAHLAGVAAQTAMVGPVNFLNSMISTVTNSAINGIGDTAKSILNAILNNVDNATSCVSNQATGAIVNDVIGKISSGLSSAIGGIQAILQFFGGFSVEGTLRTSADALGGIAPRVASNELTIVSGDIKQWVIGKGPKAARGIPFQAILDNANIAASLASGATGTAATLGAFDIFNSSFKNPSNANTTSATGGCYSGVPTICKPPIIKIFGGGGKGAKAIPLFGSVVGSGKKKTGSIIGIKVTNGGSGYTSPPFVDIIDNCKQGYGAQAKAVIENGKVKYIYLVSEGENYPVGKTPNYVVQSVEILDGGDGYDPNDQIIDDLGNQYNAEIDGTIRKVFPLNNIVTDLPALTVISDTGFGAILKPVLGDPPPIQGEVKQVIDCITK